MLNYVAVFVGGGLGALLRYCLCLSLPKTHCVFPLGTLSANFLGCFFASAIFTYFVTKSNADSVLKNFLIIGFCGGLSTLSALSLEVFEFMQAGLFVKAGLYIFTSLLICVVSVILGVVLVKEYV